MNYSNPDWDPLQTLEDITIALVNQAQAIRNLAEHYNQLNARVTYLEERIKQDQAKI